MSKILAISDIHIHDYPQRNPSDKYRLYQTRLVANNIVAAAKREGAEYIVIAGDVLEKSIIRPYVQAEVKLFLDTIMPNFTRGFIIWGNHDLDNKGIEQNFTDSCLSVMLPPNLHYSDGKEFRIGNSRIAFSNWKPEFDLSWINGCVDVLFTHATISYSKSDFFKSQELDESKFNLAICGDIHKPGSIGKFVSIGIPQRCKMSDGEYSSGVIYDCDTHEWKWIELNPDDNLMKFQYTTSLDKDGWDEESGTWNIYKAETFQLADGVQNIKIPAWEEVDRLITDIIQQNQLMDLHSHILGLTKNDDSHEVDFNFVLTRFYCKNWRSIDEVELYFEEGDKVLITGKNGAGKSSLLSAIKYAFLYNRFVKDFIQFGTKECLTEVEFIYQQNTYVIQRGSKKYGLWVNGEAMKYNNKEEFNEDILNRFPFINYMEIYFFDADHHSLLGNLKPEQKSEIVSKFYKLDKIDSYNSSAMLMLNDYKERRDKLLSEKKSLSQLLDYVNQRLSSIKLPEKSLEELVNLKNEGLQLKRNSEIWKTYEFEVAKLNSRIEYQTSTIERKSQELQGSRSLQLIDSQLISIEETIELLTKQLEGYSKIDRDIELKQRELNEVKRMGSELRRELNNSSDRCPTCGKLLDDAASVQSRQTELRKKIDEKLKEFQELNSDLNVLLSTKSNLAEEVNSKNADIVNSKAIRNELLKERSKVETLAEDIKEMRIELNNFYTQLHNMPVPEKVILPDNFLEELERLNNDIMIWENYLKDSKEASDIEKNIGQLDFQINDIDNNTSELFKYIKITGTTGKIYEEVLTRLATQFTDSKVKYEVVTYSFKNKEHLELKSSFNNNGNWVGYQACSSGQKTVLDVNFLSKVVTRMGLLVMDEFLKHLDPANHDICIDLISSMNIGCIMLSSHMESIASFNNKSCVMDLNDSGVTKITLTK